MEVEVEKREPRENHVSRRESHFSHFNLEDRGIILPVLYVRDISSPADGLNKEKVCCEVAEVSVIWVG